MFKRVWFGASSVSGAATIVAMVVLMILGTVLWCSAVDVQGSYVATGHQVRVSRITQQGQVSAMLTVVRGSTVIATSGQPEDAVCSGSTLCIAASVGTGTGFNHLSIMSDMSQFRSGSGSVASTTAYMGGTQPAIGTAQSPKSTAWSVWPQTQRAQGRSLDLPNYRVVIGSRCLQPRGTSL